jgi:hypothetical protein
LALLLKRHNIALVKWINEWSSRDCAGQTWEENREFNLHDDSEDSTFSRDGLGERRTWSRLGVYTVFRQSQMNPSTDLFSRSDVSTSLMLSDLNACMDYFLPSW